MSSFFLEFVTGAVGFPFIKEKEKLCRMNFVVRSQTKALTKSLGSGF